MFLKMLPYQRQSYCLLFHCEYKNKDLKKNLYLRCIFTCSRLADYHQTIIKIQAEEKEKRDIELAMMNGRTLKEGEVVLRCRKCDAFACMSSDIRTVEKAHHVIIDPEFSDRRTEKYQPKHIKISGGCETVIRCKQYSLLCFVAVYLYFKNLSRGKSDIYVYKITIRRTINCIIPLTTNLYYMSVL